MKSLFISILVFLILNACNTIDTGRKEVILNGVWDLAITGSISETPKVFDRKVPVPGLVDMAEPVFQDSDSTLYASSTYWYKKTFTVDHSTSVLY